MHIDFLKEVFRESSADDAFIWKDASHSYAWLLERIAALHEELNAAGLGAGRVAMLHGDFSPHTIAALLALVERSAIVVPVAPSSEPNAASFAEIAEAEFDLRFDEDGTLQIATPGGSPSHPLQRELTSNQHPGIVLFSSGTTGEPKGVVHDVTRLLGKYRTRRRSLRTLAFLLFDHIGGLDTAFYNLSNGSCLVLCEDRSPESVCRTIERHAVAVLPTAPSFLNLLSISGASQRHDLSSLEIVTYGAEMMPQGTLDRCREMFPNVTIMQKYGTSEVGTLRSKSRSSDSLWVKIGGEGYETRVVDGKLEIKAESSMLGYLNAESPFTEDGWFMTGDTVEVEGDYIRFLGRESDIINVGGAKVHPAEVETVIGELPGIEEVAVYGEDNSLMGKIVCAIVRTTGEEDSKALQRRIRLACREKLDSYKVPAKIECTDQPLTTDRFKLSRRNRS